MTRVLRTKRGIDMQFRDDTPWITTRIFTKQKGLWHVLRIKPAYMTSVPRDKSRHRNAILWHNSSPCSILLSVYLLHCWIRAYRLVGWNAECIGPWLVWRFQGILARCCYVRLLFYVSVDRGPCTRRQYASRNSWEMFSAGLVVSSPLIYLYRRTILKVLFGVSG